MDERTGPKKVFVDDAKLAAEIQQTLAKVGTHVELHVIRAIMQHQQNNYENLGIIRIIYPRR